MVRWLRWHCPPDTGFEIRALAVWGRARYLSVTEAPHNTDFHTWMGKKHFCFFETAETENRTPNSGVKGSGANHYPRTPAPLIIVWWYVCVWSKKRRPNVGLMLGRRLRRWPNIRSIYHSCVVWWIKLLWSHLGLNNRCIMRPSSFHLILTLIRGWFNTV